MLFVAVAAFACAGMKPNDARPGWHYPVGRYRVGVCRDDPNGRAKGPHGASMGWTYDVGVWDVRYPKLLCFGLRACDGRACLRLGNRGLVL